MSLEQPIASLRRTLLAASVIDDIDVVPTDEGVILGGSVETYLTWHDIATAIGPHPPDSVIARVRLATTLRLHAWVQEDAKRARAQVRVAARLLAMHPDHALHPGDSWVQERVLGGALDCGIGLVSESSDGADAVPLPPSVAEAAQISESILFADLRVHAHSMGQLVVARLHRDDAGARSRVGSENQAVLRPVGGLDVPSLLATAPVRSYLADSDGSGMRAIAVPIRSRGWYDLARVDPAFVQAAWSASSEVERGLPRSLLVTEHEVAQGPGGQDVIDLALADPAHSGRGIRVN